MHWLTYLHSNRVIGLDNLEFTNILLLMEDLLLSYPNPKKLI